jgi:hypothetical protein
MKTLVYTISDFKPHALDCISLLRKSLSGDFDFCIISNKKPENCPFQIFVDPILHNYIGFLKYSPLVPFGYDRYLYLDSDILYFDDVDKFFSEKKISVVLESLRMSDEWFNYSRSGEDFSSYSGINAGSFGFYDYRFLSDVRGLFEPFISEDVHRDARLEQSSYNYAVMKTVNKNFSLLSDMSKDSVLFAQANSPLDKKLYHFCGFSNEMASKYFKMKQFYDRYTLRTN